MKKANMFIQRIVSAILTVALFCFSIFITTPTIFVVGDHAIAVDTDETPETSESEELEIRFFPLGNQTAKQYTDGDSCIITFGDVQIFIAS